MVTHFFHHFFSFEEARGCGSSPCIGVVGLQKTLSGPFPKKIMSWFVKTDYALKSRFTKLPCFFSKGTQAKLVQKGKYQSQYWFFHVYRKSLYVDLFSFFLFLNITVYCGVTEWRKWKNDENFYWLCAKSQSQIGANPKRRPGLILRYMVVCQCEESQKTMKIFTDCVPNTKAKSGPIKKGD